MNGPAEKLPNSTAPAVNPEGLSIAFTWSPSPNLQREDPQEGYKLQLPVLRQLVRCCAHIKLHPEFHLNGSLHYHAILLISDKIKWYKSVLPNIKKNGFVCVKKNPNEVWTTYIEKDWDISRGVLGLEKPLDLMTLKKLYGRVNLNTQPSSDNTLSKYMTIEDIPKSIDVYHSVFVRPPSMVKDDDSVTSSDYSSEEPVPSI